MRYLKLIFLVAVVPFIMGSGTREMKLTEGIQPGNLAPAIELQGVSLKNKGYVILQFWAAYDAESRAHNVQVHNLISRMGAENLRLISISLDERKSVFEGTVKADNLNAETQFNEPAGNQSGLFKDYRLEKGFGNWLIDPQGVIVAKDLKLNEILEIIKTKENG